MGKLLKLFLSIIATIILLIVIAAIILPMVVDPNDYKSEIQSAVKDNLGRELIIEGDLELSVFPWIGVSTGKLSLSNAKGFEDKTFAVIEESNIKVKLIPLISKEIEISKIVLKGLVLNLAKNKEGVANWDDLISAEKTPTSDPKQDQSNDSDKPKASSLAALAIGGISIEQANIVWDDQEQGEYTEINNLNFTTEKFQFNQPIGIDLSMMVVKKSPELNESITLSTDLIVNEAFNVFNLDQFEIESITSGKNIPGNKLIANLVTDIKVDLIQQTLNISGLKLNSGNLTLTADINGTQISDKPTYKGSVKIAEFNLAQLLKSMAISLPDMQDTSVLTQVSMNFNISATESSADIQDIFVKLDDTNITGSSQIKNFSKPAINFNINIDDINLDRYMAPKKQKQTKSVATPASAAAATATLFPVERLRGLNANGQFVIGKLRINNLNMQGISLNLKAKNGVINTQQRIKSFYQGTYSGNTTINVKNRTPWLALNEKLSKVQIEPLLNDMVGEARITGAVNATAKLHGRGNTSQAIKSSLKGNIVFNFNNGVVKGFNLQKILDNGKALLKGTGLPTNSKNDQTVFSVIKGTATVRNGLVSNKDLLAEASKLRVNGAGTASLASGKLDYKVNAKLLKSAATATQAEKIKGIPIIIKVGGTFSKPSYQLDVTSMFLEKNKEKINQEKDKLLKKLDEKLAPGVGDLIRSFGF